MSRNADLRVSTRQGFVQGIRRPGAVVFHDIPYAAPPIGPGRFAAPQPHSAWSGVRDATRPGPTAPQPRRGAFGELDLSPYFGPGWIQGEDYLTVTVWAPEDGGRDLPVMVFVHGGGFLAGSSRAPLYDGTSFARDGVILVTLNYRLGITGWLDLPGAPANRGLLDVIAALDWVQQNIPAFGGNPDQVTLFGQSAGATLVSAVLADPEAVGRFARAVIQSGNPSGALAPEQAAVVTQAVAGALGIRPILAAFGNVPDQRLIAIMPALTGLDLNVAGHLDPLAGISPFGVVADRQPAELLAEGNAAGVDLLIGTTADEGNLYLVPSGAHLTSTEADLVLAAARSHRDPERTLTEFRARLPHAGPGELRAAILSEALFVAGTRQLLELRAGQPAAVTFSYEFAWRSSALDGRLGASHVMEVPFVFDVTEQTALHGRTGLLGLPGPHAPPHDLAARVHAVWIGFARDGTPGWPPYTRGNPVRMRMDRDWSLTSAR